MIIIPVNTIFSYDLYWCFIISLKIKYSKREVSMCNMILKLYTKYANDNYSKSIKKYSYRSTLGIHVEDPLCFTWISTCKYFSIAYSPPQLLPESYVDECVFHRVLFIVFDWVVVYTSICVQEYLFEIKCLNSYRLGFVIFIIWNQMILISVSTLFHCWLFL